MTTLRIFVSSVQREFAEERAALRDYLRGDPLMRRFFDAFLFEDVPATDRRPDALYLDEVERCDLYVGLFGREYGTEGDGEVSPTEREFHRAGALGKHRLIFVRGGADDSRHPRMQALIDRAQADLVRRRFSDSADLLAGLYAALVEYLERRELLRGGPFDAAPCPDASFDDLDRECMTAFIGAARRARQFALADDAAPEALLEHLNLLNGDRVTNAAVLLFGKRPQRFLISSEVKCAHFHGTRVGKPIPSYQVYRGTVFGLIDLAVDFVLSKIALSVGTRAESVQAPVAYDPEGGRDRGHRQRRGAPGLHERRQRPGHAVRGPPGGLEPRRAAAAADPRQAAGPPRVGARQSVAGARDVPGQVHRADGDRNPRHDRALRRRGPPRAGVRSGRRVRDPNTARGAGRSAGRVHRPERCAEQNEGEGRVAARVAPS